MTKHAAAAALVLAGGILGGCACGFDHRAAERSATDARVASIPADPVDTTIAALVANGTERRVWRVRAHVDVVAGPLDDGDYHLRLSDGAGNRIIAESIDPRCAAGSPFLPEIAAVRGRMAAGGLAGKDLALTGIGFRDDEHSVIGAAPTGIELHPLLRIEQIEQ